MKHLKEDVNRIYGKLAFSGFLAVAIHVLAGSFAERSEVRRLRTAGKSFCPAGQRAADYYGQAEIDSRALHRLLILFS